MSIFILLAILLFSSFLTITGDIKVNDKQIKPYHQRLFYCFIATIILLLVVSWFVLLPLIGLFSLL